MTLFLPAPAHAACLNPAGNAGDVLYNSDYSVMQYCNGGNWVNMGLGASTASACASPGYLLYNHASHVLQFCNGLNWIPAGPVPGAGGGGCTGGSEGTLVYNADHQVLQYCDGTNWIAAGGAPSVGPLTGLFGWWKLDETSGTTAGDSSGNGNTGTLNNAPTWTTSGQFNGALTLNGTNQSITVPDAASLDLSGSWSVSAWVNLTALPTSGGWFELVVKAGNDTGDNYNIALDNGAGICSAGPHWFVNFNPAGMGSTNEDVCYTPGTINTGTWYHIAGTWNSVTQTETLYINGVQVGQAVHAFTPSTGAGHTLTIGKTVIGTAFAKGTLDDVRVYNRELGASEIWQLYQAAGGQ